MSLTDLAATILDVAGVAAPEGMDGRSLAAELHGAPSLASQWATERGDGLECSVRIDDLKLWTVGPLEPRAHDLAADPRDPARPTSRSRTAR